MIGLHIYFFAMCTGGTYSWRTLHPVALSPAVRNVALDPQVPTTHRRRLVLHVDAKGMKTILVCGDLNIDLLKHESHNSTRNFLDMMYSLGLYPLIDKPTSITDTTATLIDNIFTNELHHKLTSGILFIDISDHLPIFALCEFNVTRSIVNGFQYIITVN